MKYGDLPREGGDENPALKDRESITSDTQAQVYSVMVLGREQLNTIEIKAAWREIMKKLSTVGWA